MLGIDSIQKVYGSNHSLIPPAITALVRNAGLAFCQSASSMKVCIQNTELIITLHLYIIFTFILF